MDSAPTNTAQNSNKLWQFMMHKMQKKSRDTDSLKGQSNEILDPIFLHN